MKIVNGELRSSATEADSDTEQTEIMEDIQIEEREPFLTSELAMFRLILARIGLSLMYLAGITIIGLAIYNAFFVIGPREDLFTSITESLIASVGGFVLVVTTWLWKKIV